MSLTLITIIWEKKIPPKKCQTLKLYLFHFKTKMIPQMLQEASRSVAASKNNNYLVQDCFFILFKGSIEPDRSRYLVQFYQLLEVRIPGKKYCKLLDFKSLSISSFKDTRVLSSIRHKATSFKISP